MTRVVLDTNILFSSALRRILLEIAEGGWFTPLWSDRILDEWRVTAGRKGMGAGVEAEIAALRAQHPEAEVICDDSLAATLHLPDPDDAHVLAAAITAGAEELLTQNVRDFPGPVLSAHGVLRRAPDEFLLEALAADPDLVGRAVAGALEEARVRVDPELTRRAFLKRARLPRLGKAMG